MLRNLARQLNEPVMGFLALTAMTAGVAPLLFALSPRVEAACDAAGWLVVGLFGLEYSVHFAVAADRRKFALDPWRVLDAVIIVASLASLLPVVSELTRLAPALRVLRLVRALLFGARAGHGLGHTVLPPRRAAPYGPPQVTLLRDGDAAPRAGDWGDLLRVAARPTGEWAHAANLPPERLREVAAAARVPHVLIEAALHESSFPRIESGAHWTALTLSVPAGDETGNRDPMVVLVTEDDVLSLALHPLDIQHAPAGFDGLAWAPRCALSIIRHVIGRNEAFAGQLEHAVRQLEAVPPESSPRNFFERTFRLKRLLSSAKGDLWRLRGLLEMLGDGRRTLPGLGEDQRAALRELTDEADYLHETVEDLHEAVVSIIDLHIDIAAHDMNRFMRLLAIASVLGLIPAIAGGLLGMNLSDSPWSVTLGEVAFVTLVLMIGVLYAFMAKGWLR